MAQRVIREFIDDIDGSVAERTFTFAVDGAQYEIDLSSENIKEFTDAVAGFVESARRMSTSVPGKRGRKSSGAVSAPSRSREQTQAVREWARQNGWNVSDRGRIPTEVQRAFDHAHSSGLAAVG